MRDDWWGDCGRWSLLKTEEEEVVEVFLVFTSGCTVWVYDKLTAVGGFGSLKDAWWTEFNTKTDRETGRVRPSVCPRWFPSSVQCFLRCRDPVLSPAVFNGGFLFAAFVPVLLLSSRLTLWERRTCQASSLDCPLKLLQRPWFARTVRPPRVQALGWFCCCGAIFWDVVFGDVFADSFQKASVLQRWIWSVFTDLCRIKSGFLHLETINHLTPWFVSGPGPSVMGWMWLFEQVFFNVAWWANWADRHGLVSLFDFSF